MTYKLLPSSGATSVVDFHTVKELRWEGKTHKEISDIWKVSRQYIEQICKKYGFIVAPPSPVIPHREEKHFRRLINNHTVNPETGCWEWTKALSKEGYARVSHRGKADYGHRVSYKVFFGEIPNGLCVCHTCDNPKCINPEHLWLGTHQENMADRDAKCRGRAFSKRRVTVSSRAQ